jgi:hypothetical protein
MLEFAQIYSNISLLDGHEVYWMFWTDGRPDARTTRHRILHASCLFYHQVYCCHYILHMLYYHHQGRPIKGGVSSA